MSRLDELVEEAYYYGLTPTEVKVLEIADVVSYIKANKRRAHDEKKLLAEISYAGGLVASTSMSSKRPRFSELFHIKENTTTNKKSEITQSKNMLMYYAHQMNRIARQEKANAE